MRKKVKLLNFYNNKTEETKMGKPKKQRKYKVFTIRRLKALVKMAESQHGVIIVGMESAGHKFPGQLQLTEKSYWEVMEFTND